MRFRLKYFFSHVCISLVVACISLLVLFNICYPAPLDVALGIRQVIFLMIAVDVSLGPIVTLIIAKEGKKKLKSDLIIIGIVQILALSYGIYSINKGRPIWLAFDVNRFEVVQDYAIKDNKNAQVVPPYDSKNWSGPKWVYVRPADTEDELRQRIIDELEKGVSATTKPELYQPIDAHMDEILVQKRPLSSLYTYNQAEKVKSILAQYPEADSCIPLAAPVRGMTVLLDSSHKQILGIVNLLSF